MKFTEYIKTHAMQWAYVFLVLVFLFLYFIVYRTESRIAWYNEMHIQSENMIKEFKEAIGIE